MPVPPQSHPLPHLSPTQSEQPMKCRLALQVNQCSERRPMRLMKDKWLGESRGTKS